MIDPKARERVAQPGWQSTWEEHERAQMLRLARLPLAEKLAWLEEAQRVVAHLTQRHRARKPPAP